MSDKSGTGDDEIDLALITLALMESNFDLDKVVKRFKGLGEKRRIRDVLAQAEVRIDEVERSTHDPESRLAMRRLLADIRKGSREAGS